MATCGCTIKELPFLETCQTLKHEEKAECAQTMAAMFVARMVLCAPHWGQLTAMSVNTEDNEKDTCSSLVRNLSPASSINRVFIV